MQIYHVWKNNCMGLNEECLLNENRDYVGIKTGKIYDRNLHYHSEQYKAKIIAVDDINQTGMYHLYKEINEKEENNKSWKIKYIGCLVTVERAHHCGDLDVYRCLELGDYWSENEIKII